MHFNLSKKQIISAILCGLSLADVSRVVAAGQSGEAFLGCPGAAAWYRAHPQDSYGVWVHRDSERSFSEPGVRNELAERFDRDQAARKAVQAAPRNGNLIRIVNQVDAENVAWLWSTVRRIGFPDVEQVGEVGVHNAWLLAQHSDMQPTFQAELLPSLQKLHSTGQLDGPTLSKFIDRVFIAQHRLQRYGTQFSENDLAEINFGLPVEESVRAIDRNRRELDLMPLADYVCMMRYDHLKR